MNKFMAYLAAIGITIMLAYGVGFLGTEIGLPPFVVSITCFLMGWMLPGQIMQWIYKQETQASETQEHE